MTRFSVAPKPAAASDPVADMMAALRKAGRAGFTDGNLWESALCALILALEPRCRIYRVLESLPWQTRSLDQVSTLNTFAHLGYFARPVKSNLHDIDPRLLPCLFINAAGKPMAILAESNHNLMLYRPGGTVTVPKGSTKAESGTAWIFERYDENRPATSKFMRSGTSQTWFGALLGRFRGTFTQVLLAGLALNMIALSTPLYTMLVYDRVIAAGSLKTLPMLAAGVGLSIVFEWLLRRIRSRGLSWLAARMDNIVGNKIFSHLIGLPPELIERASVAAQIARIKTFEAVRDFFSGSVFLSMLELPFTILAAIAIYVIAGPLVFVPLSILTAYGLLFLAIQREVKTAIRLAAKASSARQQFTIETFEKINGVRAYGLSTVWQTKFRDLSGREMLSHFRLNWLGMAAETCAHAITISAAVATVGFGVHLVWAGEMTTGALVASMILVWRVLTPFYSLCTMIPRLEQLRNSIIQVNKLMDLDTEAAAARTAARLPKMLGRVGFSHARLHYAEDGDAVFSNLSFEAKAGDLVVVTGENGAGKTSLLKLVKGLYTAQHGAVLIDGFDIRQLDAPDLRRQIAYVPQQPDFFRGTVLDNLRFGNPLAGEEEVHKALLRADAWNDVIALPQGLSTVIGRYGEGVLPGGLASRLSLARAYLHPAPILLIDELPNVLLSGRTGRNLRDYLAEIRGQRTCIIVTYREDFMNMADTVVTLRRGEEPLVSCKNKILQKNMENA